MGVRGEIFSNKVTLPNRTYFFNVKENRLGDIYLNVVESKNKEDGGFDRQSVVLFADDLQEFLKGFDESLRILEKAVREKRHSGKDFAKRDESRPRRERDSDGGYEDKSRSGERVSRSRTGSREGSEYKGRTGGREGKGEREYKGRGGERASSSRTGGERAGRSRGGERSGGGFGRDRGERGRGERSRGGGYRWEKKPFDGKGARSRDSETDRGSRGSKRVVVKRTSKRPSF